MKTQGFAAIGAVLVLAGCMGSGGGDGGDSLIANPSSYGDYVNNNTLLKRELELLPDTDIADVPTTGSATYSGTTGFNVRMSTSEQTQMFGAIELTTFFAGDGDVTGQIEEIYSDGNIFTEENAGAVEGELIISNGAILRDQPDPRFNPQFEAELTGTLVEPDGRTENYDGTIDGRFYGDDLEMVSGGINGQSNVPGFGTSSFTGTFNAAQ